MGQEGERERKRKLGREWDEWEREECNRESEGQRLN